MIGQEAVRITADANILVRAIAADDPDQARLAQAALAQAEIIAVPLPTLCERVWVLSRGYGVAAGEIAAAIRALIDSATVAANRPAIEAGLALLNRGGDFADGVIAHEGESLGADVLAMFGKDAAKRLTALGKGVVVVG